MLIGRTRQLSISNFLPQVFSNPPPPKFGYVFFFFFFFFIVKFPTGKMLMYMWIYSRFLFVTHVISICEDKMHIHIRSKKGMNYDGPNGSLFISMLLHNSEFWVPNSEFRNLHYEFRNCEVYVMWTSGNRYSTLEGILNSQTKTKGSTT